MDARFRWLLETMMKQQGIDIQELDTSLTYWEAKAEIESKFRTKLVLKLDKLDEHIEEELKKIAETYGAGEEA